MTEISSASCLASWLGDKPPEFACVLAARIALRVAPILRNTLRTDDMPRRARIVLPCFRALAAARFAGAWPGRIADIRQAARSAAREARDAMSETYNEVQMNVFESREAIPEEHLYIQEIEADANALGVASGAVDAITNAVQTANDLVDASGGLVGFEAVFESVISTRLPKSGGHSGGACFSSGVRSQAPSILGATARISLSRTYPQSPHSFWHSRVLRVLARWV
jgi:hypothetical protein